MADKLYRWRGTDQRWLPCTPNNYRALQRAGIKDPTLDIRLLRVEDPRQPHEHAETLQDIADSVGFTIGESLFGPPPKLQDYITEVESSPKFAVLVVDEYGSLLPWVQVIAEGGAIYQTAGPDAFERAKQWALSRGYTLC